MIRQHHGHSGQESEQTPGDSEGQGSLACCMRSTGGEESGRGLATEQQSQGTQRERPRY